MNHPCFEPDHPFTDLLTRFPREVRDDLFMLGITMSKRFDAVATGQWRHRMQSHLASIGLVAAIAPCRVAVLAVGRSMTEADRGAVLWWLVAQPEVVFVHIERRSSRRVSIGCARPTSALEPVKEVSHGRA